jgi:glycerophosphoryl diester phosphodiesterase
MRNKKFNQLLFTLYFLSSRLFAVFVMAFFEEIRVIFNYFLRTMLLISCMTQFLAHSCIRIGHRGAAGYEPENTLRSFNRAIKLGVDMIELDVHLCASGELVVIHDDMLERTTNGLGKVVDRTLAALKRLDAGKGEKIPTLRDVFDEVNRRVVINIELKGKYTAVPTARLIDEYVRAYGWSPNDFIVSSFDIDELVVFAQQETNVQLGLLCKNCDVKNFLEFYTEAHDRIIGPWLKFIGMHYTAVNPSLFKDIHAENLQVYVFTVNNHYAAWVLKQLGVDGIFSDYPDVV